MSWRQNLQEPLLIKWLRNPVMTDPCALAWPHMRSICAVLDVLAPLFVSRQKVERRLTEKTKYYAQPEDPPQLLKAKSFPESAPPGRGCLTKAWWNLDLRIPSPTWRDDLRQDRSVNNWGGSTPLNKTSNSLLLSYHFPLLTRSYIVRTKALVTKPY